MIINIHAGHNPDGKVACGATGFIKESTEARNVVAKVVSMLEARGHTVYDCTCNNGTSQSDVLKKIVTKCNAHNASLDVSVHFNAGASKKKNGKTTGTEVYVYSSSSKAVPYAKRTCEAISALGFTNRGVKTSTSLYVLKNTKAPAMLIECCFVDDPDDAATYNSTAMAEAIAYGITGVEAVAITKPAVPYTVRTPANTIVYKDASVSSGVALTLNNPGIYTIVKEKSGFGKLKSGVGWINLSKVERT